MEFYYLLLSYNTFVGPPEKEKYFYRVRDDNNQRIHHMRKGHDRKDYRNDMENWEVAEVSKSLYC